MIDLQILNKILSTGKMDIIFEYGLGVEYFPAYEREFNYIQKFWRKYAKTPDKETFINQFPEFNFIAVNDPDKYLVDGIKEEYLYSICVPVANEFANKLKSDSVAAVDYLKGQMPALVSNTIVGGVDLVKQSQKRNEARKKKTDKHFLSTGFIELDNMLSGIQRGEELLTIFARTNQGKSWLALKLGIAAMLQGVNVVMYSGEMSDDMTGYRFDSLMGHFSNIGLMRNNLEDEKAYEKYLNDLERTDRKFVVLTPKLLGGKASVSKLVAVCEKEKAGLLIVDQISLMRDERAGKGDGVKQRYANISEDLFVFSEASGIPVVLAAQANRKSVEDGDNDLPDLQGIAGADDIAQNSSKVLAIRQKEDAIEIAIRKNRGGRKGGVVRYSWDIDKGVFDFINAEDGQGSYRSATVQMKKQESGVRKPQTKEEVF